MSHRGFRRAALLAGALLLAACARRRDKPAGEGFTSIVDVGVTLIVENDRPMDYNIYLGRMGGIRLGLARGPARTRFLLTGGMLPHTGDLRVVGIPIAGNNRDVVEARANVPHGRTVRMRILPHDVYMLVDPLPEEPDSTKTEN